MSADNEMNTSGNKVPIMETYASSSSLRRYFCHMLARIRSFHLILCLLMVLIVTAYYFSNSAGDSLHVHKSRSKLEYHEDLDTLKSSNLKEQFEELPGMKPSANNELRDLERRRLSLHKEISQYKIQVENFRKQQEHLEKKIPQSKLNLDQLKLEESEMEKRFMPVMNATNRVLLTEEVAGVRQPLSLPQRCQMHACFDYSRCSLVAGFPVYVYEMEKKFAHSKLNKFIKSSVYNAFEKTPYITNDPKAACVFVAVVGEPVSKYEPGSLQKYIQSLTHWNGDGQNHVLLALSRSLSDFDMFRGVNTGRAIIVQSSFVETIFRDRFDIVVPPSLGNSDGPVWAELPPFSPVRRKFLLSYMGQFPNFAKLNIAKDSPDAASDSNFKVRQLHAAVGHRPTAQSSRQFVDALTEIEVSIVNNLKQIQADSKEQVHLKFVCDKSEKVGIHGEWCLCDSEPQRREILRHSTFSIIITQANNSIASTTVFQARLFESLKSGAIPVILGDYVHMPYEEILEWKRAAIFLPKARVTELHFFLRTFSDNDVMEMKRYGRLFWENYFGTTFSIISTTLSVLRTRLQIPAVPLPDEPSQSSISNFIPVAEHLADGEEETDEMLGPIEPPFPSLQYKQNFTVDTMWDTFNKPGDPFHLFPHTPWEKVLPSDAKFIGSGHGFRPVNKGEGGSGKEFSQVLGGNYPREQFTNNLYYCPCQIDSLMKESPWPDLYQLSRSKILIRAITRLKGLPYLNKVIVVWNNPQAPSENLGWSEIGVPVVVVKMSKNSLNNRFLPFESIETEAVLSMDDDSHLRHDEIVFGFRVWREERDRIVGFPGRYHAWNAKHKSWLYEAGLSCEISMVLTGAAFFHKYYAYLYSYVMPQAIRDKVDEYVNCEDIAMNFLVSHITRKPPVKVSSRWRSVCPLCPKFLSLDKSHYAERNECLNFFTQVYGYTPLLYTQYRVDSMLFKTEVKHENQKCFRFV